MSLTRSLKALLTDTVGVCNSRVALLGLELMQARADLLRQGTLMFFGFVLFFLASLLATFFVIVLVWETPYRHWVVLALAVLYAMAGGILLWRAKRDLSDPESQPFAATLEELSRDAKFLSQLGQPSEPTNEAAGDESDTSLESESSRQEIFR